jgi:hypothetical protein
MKPKRKQNETNNNDNNDNNKDIREECQKFVEKYGQDMINKFLNYWLEKDKTGKEKWRKKETWETGRRLATWHSNNFGSNPVKKQKVNGINNAIV